jgi:hypothetical protein
MKPMFIIRCPNGHRVRASSLTGPTQCLECGCLIEGQGGRVDGSYGGELKGLAVERSEPWGD